MEYTKKILTIMHFIPPLAPPPPPLLALVAHNQRQLPPFVPHHLLLQYQAVPQVPSREPSMSDFLLPILCTFSSFQTCSQKSRHLPSFPDPLWLAPVPCSVHPAIHLQTVLVFPQRYPDKCLPETHQRQIYEAHESELE